MLRAHVLRVDAAVCARVRRARCVLAVVSACLLPTPVLIPAYRSNSPSPTHASTRSTHPPPPPTHAPTMPPTPPHPQEALRVYEEMVGQGHEPNTTTYNALISAHSKAGDLSKVLATFREMVQKVRASSRGQMMRAGLPGECMCRACGAGTAALLGPRTQEMPADPAYLTRPHLPTHAVHAVCRVASAA